MADYITGLRLLLERLDLMLIALHKAMLMLFFGSTFQVIQVAIAEAVFVVGREGSLGVGILFATLGLGTGVGPLVVRHFIGDRDPLMRLAILMGYLLAAIGLVVASSLANLAVTLLGSFVVGLGDGLLWVFSTQLLLHAAPAAVRGRVLATEFALFTLASAAGAAVAGAALDHPLPITVVLLGMAALSLLPAAGWGLWLLRNRSADKVSR
jgi:MFS family permease